MRRLKSAIGVAALVLAGCQQQQKPPPPPARPAAATTADLLAQGSPRICTADDVKQTLLGMVKPDTSVAKALANGGTYPFHATDVDGFAAAVNLDLQLVTLSSVDKAVHSVSCDGQIVIAAPAYGLAAPAPVPIQYQVRPAIDDPDNFIIHATPGLAKEASQGIFDQMIQQIVAHASEAAAQKAFASAANAPRVLPTTSPSFDCGRVTSAVLRTVCGNDDLIALDNRLTAAYQAALAQADAAGDDRARSSLVVDERAWIQRRQQCTDIECVRSAYDDRIAQLEPAQ